jgi:enoyl-CoA hydratase
MPEAVQLDISTEHCTVEALGAVLVVTMNRPEAKNSLSSPMLVGLADAWALLDESDDYRCAVLTGAGGNFCTGMDLKGGAANPYADRWKDDPNLHWRGLLRERQPSKPIVAAVEGYAVAGGTEILQGTQLRVAAEGATFGVFEVRRGLFPVGGSTVRLQRQIAYTHAMEMLLTGRPYTAQEALSIGLVGRVVPDGEALTVALELARSVAANAPLAVEAVLRSTRETAGLDEAAALAREFEIGWPIFATDDAKEGPRAFAEKRDPVWKRS